MSKVKYSDGVSGQSGSINKPAGGATYLRNNRKRIRVIPTNRSTEFQTQVRLAFSYLGSQWVELDAAERDAWAVAWANPDYYIQDDFYGTPRRAASAKALFIKINFNLNIAANSVRDPTVLASLPPEFVTPDAVSLTLLQVTTDDKVSVTYEGTLSNDALVLFVTPSLSIGVMSSLTAKSSLRQTLATEDGSPAVFAHPKTTYGEGDLGRKVFYTLLAFSKFDGRRRTIASGNVIVAAP
ncbi:MAG: hypothetical protein ACKO0Z_26570 [Betaproteobacteria bacterium]